MSISTEQYTWQYINNYNIRSFYILCKVHIYIYINYMYTYKYIIYHGIYCIQITWITAAIDIFKEYKDLIYMHCSCMMYFESHIFFLVDRSLYFLYIHIGSIYDVCIYSCMYKEDVQYSFVVDRISGIVADLIFTLIFHQLAE